MQKITVLMSTYNGEKYIQEQLDSILKQKDVDVEIIIRDDCSSDNTRSILTMYEKRYDNIHLIFGDKNLGVTGSFFTLIRSNKNSRFFALADQDDIWDSDKLVTAVRMLENFPEDEPLLYYSNLKIVDSEGKFCRYSHTVPHIGNEKYSFLAENLATGCTVVYNQKLAEIAYNVRPKEYSIHDAWLYAVAKMFGQVIYDFTPHIQYRQHNSNQIGTYQKIISTQKIMKELKIIFDRKTQPWLNNAKIFYEEFSCDMSDKEREKIKKFIDYKNSVKNRVSVLKDKDFQSDSRSRNLRLKLKILLGTL